MILTLALPLPFSSVKDVEVCQLGLCQFIIALNTISSESEFNYFIFHPKQTATF